MKRTFLVGTFYTLAGAATLLLAASIAYSCRSGGDPHHERETHNTAPEDTHSETHSMRARPTQPKGMKLTLAHTQPTSSHDRPSPAPTPTA